MDNIINLLDSDEYIWNISDDVGHDISEQNKEIYKKIQSTLKVNSLFSERHTLTLPLSTPASKGNRAFSLPSVLQNLKTGYNPALYSKPVAVAIPAVYLKQAIELKESLVEDFFIVDQGFMELLNPETKVKQPWYVMLVDGEHRRLLQAAKSGIDVDNINSVLELDGSWKVEVTFANVSNAEQAETALKKAQGLMSEMNSKKVRKWTGQEVFFADLMSGDLECHKKAKSLKLAGIQSDNGRIAVGEKDGVKVLITQYEKALKDVRLNHNIRARGTKLFKNWVGEDFKSDETYPAIWLHACARLVEAQPSLRKNTKLWEVFCEYGNLQIKAAKGFKKWANKVKKAGAMREGVNAHHYEQIAIAVEIAYDFKTYLQGESQYNNWTLDDILEKLLWMPTKNKENKEAA